MESVDTRASQESTTTTVAGTSSIAATPSKRRLKTSSEENKQFDPGGRGEQAPPWKAAVPLPFFSGSDAGRLLVCLSGAELRGFLFFVSSMLCFFSVFPNYRSIQVKLISKLRDAGLGRQSSR